MSAQTAELFLVEELRLGRIEGSGPDVFADVHDLTVDPDGRIYVADVGWKEVRLFDRDGRFVRRLAPEGEGPGERRYLNIGTTRVTWDAHRDRLWIDDGLQRLVLDSLGSEYAREVRAPSFVPPNTAPIGTVIGVDPQGRPYQFLWGPSPNRDSTYRYVARGEVDAEYGIVPDPMLRIEAVADHEEVPRTSNTDGGSVTVTVRRPEPSRIVGTVSPAGELWVGDIDERHLRQLSFSGDTLRTILPGDMAGEPVWVELDVSPEGWFWIRRRPDSDGGGIWDLLDNCGAYRGFASVPHRVSLTKVGSGGRIHVVASGAFDFEYIMRLRLETDVAEQVCQPRTGPRGTIDPRADDRSFTRSRPQPPAADLPAPGRGRPPDPPSPPVRWRSG